MKWILLCTLMGCGSAYNYSKVKNIQICRSFGDIIGCSVILEDGARPFVRDMVAKGDCIDGLENLLGRLSNLHAFSWDATDDGLLRLPLADKEEDWQSYFTIADKAAGDRYALIEFVLNNEPEQFLQDAVALKAMLESRS